MTTIPEEALREYETLPSVQTPEQQELQDWLKGVDFATLRTLFEKVAQRCGINPEKMNFLGPDRIRANPRSGNVVGAFNALKNAIELDLRKIEEDARDLGLAPEISKLHTFIHEETHATGHTECVAETASGEKPATKAEVTRAELITGYSRRTSEAGEKGETYNLFNEGVTELLAREVTLEYIKRVHADLPGQIQVLERNVGSNRDLGYRYETALIQTLAERIAEDAGVEPRIVRDAFVRGMYEGTRLDTPEFAAFFSDAAFQGFAERLKNPGTWHDVQTLVNELKEEKSGEWKSLAEQLAA